MKSFEPEGHGGDAGFDVRPHMTDDKNTRELELDEHLGRAVKSSPPMAEMFAVEEASRAQGHVGNASLLSRAGEVGVLFVFCFNREGSLGFMEKPGPAHAAACLHTQGRGRSHRRE